MTTISLRLPDTLSQRLEQEMVSSHQSRSELIRLALENFLHERQRQRLLSAFAAEAALLDREEIAALAADFAD
ncbi:MAG: Ribbon-helix-helix protein, copG family, partial [Proteobacteria bacterium]|nr:Ribbon-helix-helix protein, copG family [Pseudomonadota bacterium]